MEYRDALALFTGMAFVGLVLLGTIVLALGLCVGLLRAIRGELIRLRSLLQRDPDEAGL